MNEYSHSRIQLSLQRALIGMITCNFQAITYEKSENSIRVLFYFKNKITEYERELVSEIITEVAADFPSEIIVYEELKLLNSTNKKLEPLDYWVFMQVSEEVE